jgi:hypothetical protein
LRSRAITDGAETEDDSDARAMSAHLLVAKLDGDRHA